MCEFIPDDYEYDYDPEPFSPLGDEPEVDCVEEDYDGDDGEEGDDFGSDYDDGDYPDYPENESDLWDER